MKRISLLDVIGTNTKIKQSQQGKRTYGKGKMRNHLEKQLSCAKVSCETQVKSTLDCTWEGSVFPYNCHTKRLQLLWVFPTKFCLPDPFFPRQTLTRNLGNFSF